MKEVQAALVAIGIGKRNSMSIDKRMKLEREDRKCSCCGKVYIHVFLMEATTDQQFIICPNCADLIHNFISNIQKSKL